jgi:hypothetical protein
VYTIVCQLISDHDAAVAKDAAIHVIEYLAQYLLWFKSSLIFYKSTLPFRVQNLDLVNHILQLDHNWAI